MPRDNGEASAADWVAFACEDGVAVVRPNGQPSSVKLPYPPGASAERRSFGLSANAGGSRLVGGFGEALVIFDVAAQTSRTVRFATDVAAMAVDPLSGHLIVLTADGRLRNLDTRSGRQTTVRRVLPRPFTPSFERPAPKLAVRGGLAAVSDPARHRVTVVRAGRLELVTRLRVAGAPTQVALAGTAVR